MELVNDIAVIKVFEDMLDLNAGLRRDWFIGVAENPKQTLKEHKINTIEGEYFYEKLSSAVRAVFVKDYFIKQGVDGRRDKFDGSQTFVYIYKKTPSTIP